MSDIEQIDVEQLLRQMAEQIQQKLASRSITDPAMVGIHTGGAWLAERLHSMLNIQEPLGTLDISFYRDDFTQKGLHPSVQPSELPFAAEQKHIILVDDVIMTGRTIRAAMNELFDYGRPASILLVGLIELDAKELPIQADVIGRKLSLQPGQRVKLQGPDPLTLELQSK